ncbi:MAG: hypothetical protein HY860_03445 [Chlamydiales bacterium]|nr:hypothetical protein [Chlamydiales bacterium]
MDPVRNPGTSFYPTSEFKTTIMRTKKNFVWILDRLLKSPVINQEKRRNLDGSIIETGMTLEKTKEAVNRLWSEHMVKICQTDATLLADEHRQVMFESENLLNGLRFFLLHLRNIQENFDPHNENPFYAHAIPKQLILIIKDILERGIVSACQGIIGKGGRGVVKAFTCNGVSLVVKEPGSKLLPSSRIAREMIDGCKKILELNHPVFAKIYFISQDVSQVYMERGSISLLDAVLNKEQHNGLIRYFPDIVKTLLQGLATLHNPARCNIERYYTEERPVRFAEYGTTTGSVQPSKQRNPLPDLGDDDAMDFPVEEETGEDCIKSLEKKRVKKKFPPDSPDVSVSVSMSDSETISDLDSRGAQYCESSVSVGSRDSSRASSFEMFNRKECVERFFDRREPLASGDIKIENIMLFQSSRSSETDCFPYDVKFIDHDTIHSVDAKEHRGSYTMHCLAPDRVKEFLTTRYQRESRTSDDLWSFGVTLFEMLFGLSFMEICVNEGLRGTATQYGLLEGEILLQRISEVGQTVIDRVLERGISEKMKDDAFLFLLAQRKVEKMLVLHGKKQFQEYCVNLGKELVERGDATMEVVSAPHHDVIGATSLSPEEQEEQRYFTTAWKWHCDHGEGGKEGLQQYVMEIGKKKFMEQFSEERLENLSREVGLEELEKIKRVIQSFLQTDPSRRTSALDALDTFFGSQEDERDSPYIFDSIYEFDPTL